MLTDDQFFALAGRLNLSYAATQHVQHIRHSQPARAVGSGRGNVTVHYPSRKMGVTIQAESHTVELPAIHAMEHDPDTIEFYDQPPPITMRYIDAKGRNRGHNSCQDFFVIRKDWIGWEQWKTEAGLIKEATKKPWLFVCENGVWRCPPGDRYAAQFGLSFAVRSDAEINWVMERNYLFLDDYCRQEAIAVCKDARAGIGDFFLHNSFATLEDLLQIGGPVTADDIYNLIVTGEIHCDLTVDDINIPHEFRVARDEVTWAAYSAALSAQDPDSRIPLPSIDLEPGGGFTWDGKAWILLNCGDLAITAKSADEKIMELPRVTFMNLVNSGKILGLAERAVDSVRKDADAILLSASAADLKEANDRVDIVKALEAGADVKTLPVPKSTAYRYLRAWRNAVKVYGNGYVGLIPNKRMRGNRRTKLPDDVRGIAVKGANDYADPRHGDMTKAWLAVVDQCEQRNLTPPSYQTVVNLINHLDMQKKVEAREGHRAAYAHAEFYWYLDQTTPRHGSRPFEIAHIDHTEIDLELKSSRNGISLGRAWLTLMIDAYSRRILAFYLTFDPPSYRSCMMIIRECVRRHGRLPQTIVVDNGREFLSVYFDSVLARFGVTKKVRPPSESRFGSLVERAFGIANKELFHNLLGNTQVMRNVRTVTKSINPKNLAIWTLPGINALFEAWVGVYERTAHPALGVSPREAFDASIAVTGARPNMRIPYTQEFLLFTSPTTAKGEAKVSATNGVKINYINYWSKSFRDPSVAGKRVAVRYDPFDMGTAYALVKGCWVKCISEHHTALQGRTEREIKLLAQEIRKQNSGHTRRRNATAAQLARLLKDARESETVALQRMRDGETRIVIGATPPPISTTASASPDVPASPRATLTEVAVDTDPSAPEDFPEDFMESDDLSDDWASDAAPSLLDLD